MPPTFLGTVMEMIWQKPLLLSATHLPRHCHGDDLAEAIIVKPVESHDLARVDVHTALRHDPDAPLWVGQLERVDIVHEWNVSTNLEVADHAVALA